MNKETYERLKLDIEKGELAGKQGLIIAPILFILVSVVGLYVSFKWKTAIITTGIVEAHTKIKER